MAAFHSPPRRRSTAICDEVTQSVDAAGFSGNVPGMDSGHGGKFVRKGRLILPILATVLAAVAQTTLPISPPLPRVNPDGAGKDLVVEIKDREKKPETSDVVHLHVVTYPAPLINGETVYARLSDVAADVDGLHQVATAPPEVLVPVFCAAKVRPTEAIDESRLRVMLDDIEFSEITPAVAPFAVEGLPRGVKVVWLSATVAPADASRFAAATGTTVRVSYRQPFLQDRFLHLPLVVPGHSRQAIRRNWPFQMFVRSTDRLLPPPEPPADGQHLGDILVVYLHDRQLVDLSIPPRKRPAKSP